MRFLPFLLVLVLFVPSVSAVVTLEVTAFNCSPEEIVLTEQFTCTASIENVGDETGSLTTAVLYPDSGRWMEEASYAETVNVNIDSGATTEVVFEGLRAQKAGVRGFSRITLDDVTDTYPDDESVLVNIIDIVTVVTQSVDSAAASTGTVDATGQATLGGDADVVMVFSVVSGGCSIGSESSSVTFSDLVDGQSVSHTWTVTMGTTTCVYSIASTATSTPNSVGEKKDTTTMSISCTGDSCVVADSDDSDDSSSSSSSSSSSGGGGGGGSSKKSTSDADEEEDDVTRAAPSLADLQATDEADDIDLSDYSSWEEEGSVSLSAVEEGDVFSFLFVDEELLEEAYRLFVSEVDGDSGEVALYFTDEDYSIVELLVAVGEPAEVDLDGDGVMDLQITVASISADGKVAMEVAKLESFLAQETALEQEKRSFRILIIVIILLALAMFGWILFFEIKKYRAGT